MEQTKDNANIIELKHVTKRFEDNGYIAVNDFNLEVKRGEFVTFLDNDGGIGVRRQFLLRGGEVAQGDEGHLIRAVEGGADLGIVRDAHGAGGAAVEGPAEGEDLGTAGVERRQFQRVLVGLRPAVAQEEVEGVIAADLSEFLGQGVLQAVLHGIGVETQLSDLLPDRRHVMRVAVPDADHGVAAVQVQVLLAVGIPQRGTLPAHGLDVPPFVYIE